MSLVIERSETCVSLVSNKASKVFWRESCGLSMVGSLRAVYKLKSFLYKGEGFLKIKGPGQRWVSN